MIGIALAVVLAVGVAVVSLDGSRAREPSTTDRSAELHGTRPPPLTVDDVAHAAAAFGISRAPVHMAGGWKAEDRVRSLYVTRSPSAWYVGFEDSSVLLGPTGERSTICARADAPFGCTVPGVALLADTAAPPPSAATAARAARTTLTDAGLLSGSWRTKVLGPSTDVPPCRPGLETAVDCTRQVIPTRAVMLTRSFGPGTTAVRWGVVIGPRGTVLSVTGRFAVPLSSPA